MSKSLQNGSNFCLILVFFSFSYQVQTVKISRILLTRKPSETIIIWHAGNVIKKTQNQSTLKSFALFLPTCVNFQVIDTMRLFTAFAAIYLIAEQGQHVRAFSLQTTSTCSRQIQPTSSVLQLSAESETAPVEKKKPLTSADILARARKAAGVPEEELPSEGPQLFEEAQLDDIQQSLLTLEKRVKGGPGSISLLELEEFQIMTGRVLKDMKEKEQERIKDLASGNAPSSSPPSPVLEAAAEPTTTATTTATAATTVEEDTTSEKPKYTINEEEGPEYDGTGGMGLAKGTTNTYIIPGMDEMSPEEYQAALQKSISDRQTKRKESGTYGNRATSDYLSNLNGEGSGMVK